MTAKTAKRTPKEPSTVHRDIFGRIITEGSPIVFPHGNSLYVGTVGKCSPKMVRVHPSVSMYRSSTGILKYANSCVMVEGADVTMYILRNSAQ